MKSKLLVTKNKIIVLLGGNSKERSVSIQSGEACYNALKEMGYSVFKFDPRTNISNKLKLIKPDIVFNCLHGKFGEDGKIQKILEKLRIPYTHSGVVSSEIAMDKIKSKKFFIKNKILTPDYKVIRKIKDINNYLSKKKFIIKPFNEGSSVGVKIFDKITKKNLKSIIKLLKEYKKLIQEEFIEGKEVQSAILGKYKLGAIEIIPKRKFYDFKAKYSFSAKTKHVMPAKIKKKLYNKLNNIALRAHRAIGCKGVTRSDFRVSKNGKIYLLEINTQPGMTKLSLVPEIAGHYGMSFNQLVKWILQDASIKR